MRVCSFAQTHLYQNRQIAVYIALSHIPFPTPTHASTPYLSTCDLFPFFSPFRYSGGVYGAGSTKRKEDDLLKIWETLYHLLKLLHVVMNLPIIADSLYGEDDLGLNL